MTFVFYLTYYLLFLFGGVIATFGLFPYRMAMVSFFPLFVLPKYPLKLDNVVKLVILFTIYVVFSGFVNNSSLIEIIYFFRFIFIPLMMYYLVKSYLTNKNIISVIKLSIKIAVIQLPIVLLQILLYDKIQPFIKYGIAKIDFDFGTFYAADDPAMSFFLIALIIFVLFDNTHNYFIKKKLLLASYLSVTIFVSNSKISILILLLIWIIFFIKKIQFLQIKKLVSALFIIMFLSIIIIYSGYNYKTQFLQKIEDAVVTIQDYDVSNYASTQNFIEGRYSRQAAILYYLSEPIKYFGDGPSKYFNPLSGIYKLGNTGQIFTFYSEIGLFGLMFGFFILYSISKNKNASEKISFLMFFLLSTLTITTSVMSDASIMFAYSLFLSTKLIPQKATILK